MRDEADWDLGSASPTKAMPYGKLLLIGNRLYRRRPSDDKVASLEMPATLTQARLDHWSAHRQGLIQNAFPDLTASQREFILTGILPEEWDEMFKEDDE